MIKALQLGLGDAYFFKKQFLAALIGAVLLFAASRMPVKLHRPCPTRCSPAPCS